MSNRRIPYLVSLALLLLVAFAACGGKTDELQPPEIFYGQDLCEECSMIISDAKFAAATIDTQGNAHKFDDIGGMLMYHMDHPTAQVRAWFVHDYITQAWTRGETAFFVRSNLIASPMDDGIAAFADKASAEQFAQKVGGQVLKFDELRVNVHLTLHANP